MQLGVCRLGRIVLVASSVAAFPIGSFAQGADVPRTPWGHPDLQGVWDFRTTTPLQRPDGQEHEVVTGEAATAYTEQQREAALYRWSERGRGGGDWIDNLEVGLAAGRTALIVDPPNGRMPPMTPEAVEKQAAKMVRWQATESYEDRDVTERCIVRPSPPLMINAYNNNLQLLQTPDTVVVLHEMINDAVIIPLDGRPHVDGRIRLWLGDSRGRWEGDTLVVETTNRHPRWSYPRFVGPTPNMRVVERFTRVGKDTLRYEYTVEDPETFSRPWSVALPMQRTDQPLYEYGCHKGNYGLPNILAGARAADEQE